MSAPVRRAKVDRTAENLSVRRQCELLNVARSGVYRPKPVAEADDLALMRRIDELHLELPFFGSRRMTFQLNEEGRGVNRKRVRRVMGLMGVEALGPPPPHETTRPGTQDLSLPLAWRGDHRAEPCVGVRHHLYSDGDRPSLSGGDHRLGQPRGAGQAAVEYDGYVFLPRRVG